MIPSLPLIIIIINNSLVEIYNLHKAVSPTDSYLDGFSNVVAKGYSLFPNEFYLNLIGTGFYKLKYSLNNYQVLISNFAAKLLSRKPFFAVEKETSQPKSLAGSRFFLRWTQDVAIILFPWLCFGDPNQPSCRPFCNSSKNKSSFNS